MCSDPQSLKVDERPVFERESVTLYEHGAGRTASTEQHDDWKVGREYVPASLVASYRDAIAEIAEARSLDEVAGILANGPLATAPGGPKEDECFRLREQRDALQEEVARLQARVRELEELREEDARRHDVAWRTMRNERDDALAQLTRAEGRGDVGYWLAEGARRERERKTELLREVRAEVFGMTPPLGGQRTQQIVLRVLDVAVRIVAAVLCEEGSAGAS